jgi:hypothetical protein
MVFQSYCRSTGEEEIATGHVRNKATPVLPRTPALVTLEALALLGVNGSGVHIRGLLFLIGSFLILRTRIKS